MYSYCAELFSGYGSVEQLRTRAYLVRLPILQALPDVVLTNPGLIDLLATLPVDPPELAKSGEGSLDMVAWEFFR